MRLDKKIKNYRREEFDKVAKASKSVYKENNRTKINFAITNDYFKRLFLPKIIKKDFIYDIGCGTGYFSKLIAKLNKNARVIGVDYSREMINKAKKNCSENIRFHQGNIYNLSNKFKEKGGVLICFEVLSAILRPDKAIGEISKLLKSDADLIMEIHNRKSFRHLFLKLFLKNYTNYIKYSRWEIKDLLIKNNFSNIKFYGIYIFPQNLFWMHKIINKLSLDRVLDKIPLVGEYISHSFYVHAKKT